MTQAGFARTKLTYRELRQFPEDGKRHELIDGGHHVSPLPETYHQALSGRVYVQLFRGIEERGEGRVFHAPMDVVLSDTDVVEPDLIVVLKANLSILRVNNIKGVPDLIVEILSRASAKRDRGLKLKLYERAGVPEYWIVAPAKRVVERFVLEGAKYSLAGTEKSSITFGGLAGVKVDLRRVW